MCRNLMVRRAVCRDTGIAGQPWLAIPLGVAITIDANPRTSVSSKAFMLGLTLSDNRSTKNALRDAVLPRIHPPDLRCRLSSSRNERLGLLGMRPVERPCEYQTGE